MAEWEKEIAIEDFPDDFREVAEEIGIPAALVVMRWFEGDKIYFPKIDGAFKAVRDRVIHREWKKSRDPRAIGQRHGLTVQQVREIVGEHEGQTTLFNS